MPSLIRFTVVLGFVGLATYAAMFALANFVVPQPREIFVSVPLHPNAHVKPTQGAPSRTAVDLESTRDRRLVTTLESLPFSGR